MDRRDGEMAEESPSISSSLDSGSKVEKIPTDRIETEDELKKSGPKTEDTESDVSSFYSDHSFDHVLDGLPRSKSMPPTKLCATCQNMVYQLRQFIWGTPRYHSRSLLDLKASAQNGCTLCATFIRTDYEQGRDAMSSKYLDEWKARFGEVPTPCSRAFMDTRKIGFHQLPRIELQFSNEPRWKFESTRVSLEVDIRESPEIYNKVFEEIDPSSNTRQSIPLIERWLIACQRLHPECKAQRPGFIPTRLIDLRGKYPKLCLGSLIEKNDLQYATLSHCWGAPEKKYQTLTNSTLINYLTKIEMEGLPKTFHDAIKVCAGLKIRYIWIDSLCIIQDDKEDWRRESVTMVDVYGSCLLNIAASSSIDGSQGCFFDRQDALRCRISFNLDGKNDAMYDLIPDTKHPLENPRVCPVEGRGWTLQERLLSPRTVHFTREEVFWECHAKFVSESSPFHSDKLDSQRNKEISIRKWEKIINNYTGRHLTYEADRLIALGGIAAKIQQQTKDEYFAGMWGNNLILQLCWQVCDGKASRRISPQRAPTWSWASVTSQVISDDIHSPFEIPLSKVWKVDKPATEHQFGDMPNVPLWLSCPPLLPVQFIMPNTMVFREKFISGTFFTMDCVEDTMLVNINSEKCTLFILQIFDGTGLILKCIEGIPGVYERIGHVLLYSYRSLELNDENNHAEQSAYVPKEEHNFDTDEHVICLV